MQRKPMIRTITGLSLLAIVGCNSQPEATTSTNTVVVVPTAESQVEVHTAPPVVVEGSKPNAAKAPATTPTKAANAATKPAAKKPTPKAPPKSTTKLGPIPKTATKLISEDITICAGPTATT